jgi:hypothetical protein
VTSSSKSSLSVPALCFSSFWRLISSPYRPWPRGPNPRLPNTCLTRLWSLRLVRIAVKTRLLCRYSFRRLLCFGSSAFVAFNAILSLLCVDYSSLQERFPACRTRALRGRSLCKSSSFACCESLLLSWSFSTLTESSLLVLAEVLAVASSRSSPTQRLGTKSERSLSLSLSLSLSSVSIYLASFIFLFLHTLHSYFRPF